MHKNKVNRLPDGEAAQLHAGGGGIESGPECERLRRLSPRWQMESRQ
jgi:hypothetical protein